MVVLTIQVLLTGGLNHKIVRLQFTLQVAVMKAALVEVIIDGGRIMATLEVLEVV